MKSSNWSPCPEIVSDSDPQPGVYASLAALVSLRFRAKGFSFLPRQPVHSILAGRHASRLRGRGLNFEEIRRYQPGDDIRQIDWKVTVRTRQTHSRVYTEERERSVLLLVDQRITMFFRQRQEHEIRHGGRGCGARRVARAGAEGPHRSACFQ